MLISYFQKHFKNPAFLLLFLHDWASLAAQLVKNLPAMQKDPDSIPGSGSSPEEEIGYPLQHSWASLVVHMVKNLPTMQETWI